MPLSDNMRGIAYINVAMLAFTLNDTCMKAVTQTLPLFQTITLRGILTTLALLVVAALSGGVRLWPGARDGRIIALRSVAEIGATIFFFAALLHMELANLSAIMQSLPLAVTLAAALFFGDPIGWRRLLAIAIGFLGVLLIIKPGTGAFNIWSIMGLCSVACVVVRDLSTRSLSAGVPSTMVAIWASVTVTLMGAVGSIWSGWQTVSMTEALLIAGATINLVIGYLTVVMMMRAGDIGIVAPFRYMALLWAIILGWVIFGTLPDALTILGGAIVVATGVFTLWRERQARLARAAT
ncbi:DMT family transporter [Aliigemmobacter aestuarii]|uniref:DMT family transporter n=1 Tax=Aliigemmobacter aestuarii TaxID=1445661 RepID=A0A4S3MS24_9RHOB|nr:DMT family transporter [Gemmobacter aestuarii]THD85247.1 DMT family transporter [Gemmobacter aestuarii]